MSVDYIWKLKASLRKESEKQLDLYRKDKFAFIEGAFSKRLAELENNQAILNTIIYSNKDRPDIQVKAVLALNETTVLMTNLFEMLPNICSLGVDAFGSSNNNDNSSVAGYNSNNNNNKSWFCANCNGRHRDEKGYHCPEWKVGLPEEEEPGYFGIIKEEDADQRKF